MSALIKTSLSLENGSFHDQEKKRGGRQGAPEAERGRRRSAGRSCLASKTNDSSFFPPESSGGGGFDVILRAARASLPRSTIPSRRGT